jgi:hypothetical protein
MIHETATPGATAANEAAYFHGGDRDASAHYFVDDTQIIQLIPEVEQAQHAGPTANAKYISIELCHFTDQTRFEQTWARGVWLAATICKRYGWTAGPNVFSHKWAAEKWKETDHTDPYGYFTAHGHTFQQFCNSVDLMLDRLNEGLPVTTPPPDPTAQRIAELEKQLRDRDARIEWLEDVIAGMHKDAARIVSGLADIQTRAAQVVKASQP